VSRPDADHDTTTTADGLDCDGPAAARADRPPAPRRRIRLYLEAGADSWDEVDSVLRQVALTVVEAQYGGAASIDSTSGAPSAGYRVTADEDPDVTHESYFRDVDAWLAADRAKEGA
jgi:hypothetical protein